MNSTFNSTTFETNFTVTDPSNANRGPPPNLPAPGIYTDAKELIWKIVPPIVIILGTFGNSLIILVLLRQFKKLSSTAVYLLSLAFSDLLILYLGPIRQWIQYIWEVDVRLFTDAGCKVSLFLTYFSMQLSSWLLVAVTTERVISVMLPHKVKLGCTSMKAGIVVLIMFVCLFGLNAHFFYGYGLKYTPANTRAPVQCVPLYDNYLKFRDDILPWLDFIVAFVLPFVLLTIGNILIIVSLTRNSKRRRKMRQTQADKEGRSITLLLTMLCTIFFICLTPASIFFIILPYLREDAMELPFPDMVRRMEYLIFWHAVVSCFSYINASTNFILYFLSGSRFRSEVRRLFTCKSAGKVGIFGSKTTRSTSLTNTAASSSRGTKQIAASSRVKEEKETNDVQDVAMSENEPCASNSEKVAIQTNEEENFTDILQDDGERNSKDIEGI